MTDFLVDLAGPYQDGINLAVVKAAGFSKVNIKLTQGDWYVDPSIGQYLAGAQANGMGISTFHWLDGKSSGAAQAAAYQAQMNKWGLRYGTAMQCDCEDPTYPATWQIWSDFVNAMQDWAGRPVINYTGDWWWPGHMLAFNGAAVTPYLWAAPDHGYDAAYPGDGSSDWNANFGGWGPFSALQYAVAPVAGAGGSNLSMTAFRNPHIWSILTGVDAASTQGDSGMLFKFADGYCVITDGMGDWKHIPGPDGLSALQATGMPLVPITDATALELGIDRSKGDQWPPAAPTAPAITVTQDELNAAVASAVTVGELTTALQALGITVTLH